MLMPDSGIPRWVAKAAETAAMASGGEKPMADPSSWVNCSASTHVVTVKLFRSNGVEPAGSTAAIRAAVIAVALTVPSAETNPADSSWMNSPSIAYDTTSEDEGGAAPVAIHVGLVNVSVNKSVQFVTLVQFVENRTTGLSAVVNGAGRERGTRFATSSARADAS